MVLKLLQLGMFFHPTAAFKAYLLTQRELQAQYVADENTKSIHGNPCSCPKCNSVNLQENVTDRMEHIVMEYEIICKDCIARVAYWAHGSFEPNYPPEENASCF